MARPEFGLRRREPAATGTCPPADLGSLPFSWRGCLSHGQSDSRSWEEKEGGGLILSRLFLSQFGSGIFFFFFFLAN